MEKSSSLWYTLMQRHRENGKAEKEIYDFVKSNIELPKTLFKKSVFPYHDSTIIHAVDLKGQIT